MGRQRVVLLLLLAGVIIALSLALNYCDDYYVTFRTASTRSLRYVSETVERMINVYIDVLRSNVIDAGYEWRAVPREGGSLDRAASYLDRAAAIMNMWSFTFILSDESGQQHYPENEYTYTGMPLPDDIVPEAMYSFIRSDGEHYLGLCLRTDSNWTLSLAFSARELFQWCSTCILNAGKMPVAIVHPESGWVYSNPSSLPDALLSNSELPTALVNSISTHIDPSSPKGMYTLSDHPSIEDSIVSYCRLDTLNQPYYILAMYGAQPIKDAFFRGIDKLLSTVAVFVILLILFVYRLYHMKAVDVVRAQRETDEMRQKNEQLQQINRQISAVAHDQRLREIGSMASGITHEFNNLLTPILSHALMVLENVNENSEIYDSVLAIYNAADRGRKIVQNVSLLSRKGGQTMEKQRLNVDVLIRDHLALFYHDGESNIAVHYELHCPDVWILADATAIIQILINLRKNALQAMSGTGGTLTISTDTVTDHDDSEHERTWLQIRVRDTGPGIREEDIPRIFDPFFTTKRMGEGSGLGLTLALYIVEVHGGKIQFHNHPDGGAVFTLLLPVLSDPPES